LPQIQKKDTKPAILLKRPWPSPSLQLIHHGQKLQEGRSLDPASLGVARNHPKRKKKSSIKPKPGIKPKPNLDLLCTTAIPRPSTSPSRPPSRG
jgi:hypothetical protein